MEWFELFAAVEGGRSIYWLFNKSDCVWGSQIEDNEIATIWGASAVGFVKQELALFNLSQQNKGLAILLDTTI